MDFVFTDMDRDDLEFFATDEETTCHCLQVAPLGDGHAAILFLLSDPDYAQTASLVFVTRDFAPETSELRLGNESWLMSLTRTGTDTLHALEATTFVWTFADGAWTRAKVAEKSLRRVWGDPSGTAVAVGAAGTSLVHGDGAWTALPVLTACQYFDVGGDAAASIYACGNQGSLHRLTDGAWRAVELNRADQFRGLDVAPDGSVRLAGDRGACLRVIDDEIREIDGGDAAFLSVRSFDGQVFWGTPAGIYLEEGDALRPFAKMGGVWDMRSDAGYLFAAAGSRAYRFDGTDWKTLGVRYEDGSFRLV